MKISHRYLIRLSTLVRSLIVIHLLAWVPQSSAQIQFEDITNQAGPFHTGETWGASWCDFNGDGFTDLYMSNHGMRTGIYYNNGDGTFSNVIDQVDSGEKLIKSDVAEEETNLADLHGGACADFDNDGDKDLAIARSSAGSQLFLFENNGHGYFSESRSKYGIQSGLGSGRMPVFLDYTGDGLLDIAYAKNGNPDMILYKRQGDVFVDSSHEAGLAYQCQRNHFAFTTRLFDTGELLFICMEPSNIPQRAYDTSTTPFTEIVDKIPHYGLWSDAVLADFDNDARLDMAIMGGRTRPNGAKRISSERIEAWLSVTSGQDKEMRFKSEGPIKVNFYSRDVTTTNVNPSDPDFGLYDRIFIGSDAIHPQSLPVTLDPQNANHQGVAQIRNLLGVYMGYDQANQEWEMHLSVKSGSDLVYFTIDGVDFTEPTVTGLTEADSEQLPKIFNNNGSELEDIPGSKGLTAVQCTSIGAADFDNDMDVDIMLGCSNSLENLPNRIFWNDGDGTFTEGAAHGAEGIVGMGIAGNSGTTEMVIVADYDADGFVDALSLNGGRLFPHFRKDNFTSGGAVQLFRNKADNGNHWLEFDLQGVSVNRDGFGAKVTLTAGAVTQLREHNGQYHRWSHDDHRLHFGLGSHTLANVKIDWPDGSIDTYNNISADGVYRLVQGGNIEPVTLQVKQSSLSINDLSVDEGGGSVSLTLSLLPPSDSTVTVDYATSNDTAIAGVDYEANSGTITFQPGETIKRVTFTIFEDSIEEDKEAFDVNLTNVSGTTLANSKGSVSITDNDTISIRSACGEPSINSDIVQALLFWKDCSGDGTWYIKTTAGGTPFNLTYTGNLTTNQSFSDVTAIDLESTDTLDFDAKNIDFKMRLTGVERDIMSFNVDSGHTCLNFSLPGGVRIFVGSDMLRVSTNIDIETLRSCLDVVQPELIINDITVSESSGIARFTLNLQEASNDTVKVKYFTEDLSAVAGSDYTVRTGEITFQSGQLSKTATITLIDDDVSESDETFNVNLTQARGATVAKSTGTATITDDDIVPAEPCGDPGYDRMTERELFIWQDCVGDGSWYVRATTGGGSALTYSGNLTTNQSFSSVVNVSVEASDTVDTGNPQVIDFNLTMGSVWYDGFNFQVASGNTCLTLDTPAGITVKVGENRTPVSSAFDIETLASCGGGGQPNLSIGDAQVNEGDGTATVNVSLSQASTSTLSVDYQTANDSASAGSDYGMSSGTLTFTSGVTSQSIIMPIIQDMQAEDTETFNVQLSNAVNASIADGTGVVTILDDDGTGGSACGDPGYDRMTERELFIWQDCVGDGSWYVRATTGGGSVLTYSGNLTTNQSFSSVVNVSVEASDTVDTGNPQVIDFNLTMGSVWYDGFNFQVASGNTCLTLDTPAGITVKVGENRTPVSSAFDIETLASCGGGGQPNLSIGDAQVNEGDNTATVNVSLSKASTSTLSVDYQTANDSASAGSDYGMSSGTLSFTPGVTSQSIIIPIIQDMQAEDTETFNVQLSNAVNASIADGTGVVTILDDDGTGGSACGDPGYDRMTERELFIWQDCVGDGSWYVRATTGGGSVLTYSGNLTTNQSFSSVVNVSVEASDTVGTGNPQVIDFNLTMGSVWYDGFNFQVASGNTCLTLDTPAGITVKVGENRTPVSSAFDIETLGPCL